MKRHRRSPTDNGECYVLEDATLYRIASRERANYRLEFVDVDGVMWFWCSIVDGRGQVTRMWWSHDATDSHWFASLPDVETSGELVDELGRRGTLVARPAVGDARWFWCGPRHWLTPKEASAWWRWLFGPQGSFDDGEVTCPTVIPAAIAEVQGATAPAEVGEVAEAPPPS